MPVFPRWVMEGQIKIMHMEMKARKTQRGRTNFMIPEPTKRPSAKTPCAPARKRAASAEEVLKRVSVT